MISAIKGKKLDALARSAVMDSIKIIRNAMLAPTYNDLLTPDQVLKAFQPLMVEVRKVEDALK